MITELLLFIIHLISQRPGQCGRWHRHSLGAGTLGLALIAAHYTLLSLSLHMGGLLTQRPSQVTVECAACTPLQGTGSGGSHPAPLPALPPLSSGLWSLGSEAAQSMREEKGPSLP